LIRNNACDFRRGVVRVKRRVSLHEILRLRKYRALEGRALR
jgi:hypothetical protein